MKKILGLDVGDKRIGVAIAEETLVAPFGVIDNTNLSEAIHEIVKISHREEIEKIIIGIPKSKDNLQSDKIHKFAIELTKNLNIEIDFVDETLTTKEAEREIKSKLDPKDKRFKEEIDKLSAKYILEQYLGNHV